MELLIVEDNLKLLEAITGALEAGNFLCETAAGREKAHEKLFLYNYNILDGTEPEVEKPIERADKTNP